MRHIKVRGDNFKLFGIVLVKICYRHADIFKIVARNVSYFIHIYGVIVIVLRIFIFIPVIMFIKHQFLMPLCGVKVRKPAYITEFCHLSAIFVCENIFSFKCIRHEKSLRPALMPQPYFIILNQWENFFIRYSVLITKNEKFFVILHKLGYVLPEQRKRRICHHNVRLFQQAHALLTAEIAVAFQHSENIRFVFEQVFNVCKVNGSVAVVVAHFVYFDFISLSGIIRY